jgi:hypothetical protein
MHKSTHQAGNQYASLPFKELYVTAVVNDTYIFHTGFLFVFLFSLELQIELCENHGIGRIWILRLSFVPS